MLCVGAKMSNVVIIGGGFAGVQAARALQRVRGARVRVIDREGLATMVPALPDVLSGRVSRGSLIRPLAEVCGRGVDVIRDTITEVNLVERLAIGTAGRYAYDGLIIASGSTPIPPPVAFGDIRYHTLHSFESAVTLRSEIERRLAGGPLHVVIVGAGYTGLEAAAALRHGMGLESDTEITVVDGASEILPMLNDRERGAVRSYLAQQAIALRTGTTLAETAGSDITLSDGTRIRNALLVWSTGMRASPLRFVGAVDRTPDGRIVTTEALGLPGYREVFAAGDAAALTRNGMLLRRAVNFAYYSGQRAGRNLAAYLRGRQSVAFTPVDLGWILPLFGTSAGRIFGPLRVGGRLGLRLHYAMCGFRHFGGRLAVEFYRTALHLRRQPDPLDATASWGSDS